ncbi:hypothetical protein ACFFGV_11750 [Pontibacillus salicampi]|uniref:Uncharacterized protein n=1 Tax=Pontibacillus salicampi TaxID=1449801 RepID=A0ABV6LPI5_9BACI
MLNNLRWLTTMFQFGRKSALFGRRSRFSFMRNNRRRRNNGGLLFTLLGIAGFAYGVVRGGQGMLPGRITDRMKQDHDADSMFDGTANTPLQNAQYAFSEEFHPEQE